MEGVVVYPVTGRSQLLEEKCDQKEGYEPSNLVITASHAIVRNITTNR